MFTRKLVLPALAGLAAVVALTSSLLPGAHATNVEHRNRDAYITTFVDACTSSQLSTSACRSMATCVFDELGTDGIVALAADQKADRRTARTRQFERCLDRHVPAGSGQADDLVI